ncbi:MULTISPECIES: hypothetical protein [unclassified Pseudomonas]|uniref:hypothetical protein n=1 Tax=unclassified Pseudomonas TaxID=196821 RepID=UPI00073074FD|nr:MULTISPECIES: hypothetical protein [unclassified Pseudomonas]KSW25688.1 hypothetical protein AOX63_18610 [Pseudomonas sp. ADP]OBP12271.1 hypothetical protein BAE52_05500 [Pseudomonas sp. EGD-AKN5]
MKLQSKLPAMPVGVSSEVTPAGKAGGQSLAAFSIKNTAVIAVVAGSMTAGMANAAITVPPEILEVFTDLAAAFGVLMAAGAVLFGVIRGGVALFKIASRIFSAAGA